MRRALLLVVSSSVSLVGCGGSAPPAAAPAADAASPMTPTNGAAALDDAKAAKENRIATVEDAQRELENAERRTRPAASESKGGGDADGGAATKPKKADSRGAVNKPSDGCEDACAALGSMQNAATRLCDLAGEGDARCAQAKDRLKNAGERVRASCPSCATAR